MYKKLYFILLLLVLFVLSLSAQMKVLFVDDSADEFGNAELIASAIGGLGYEYDYYNAVDSADSPSDLVMKNYDLVIWSTSTLGNGLQFWNGSDEDNAKVKAYLDGGGKLWLTGNDFLFDKYGPPPYTFAKGEFMYDYAGIKSYDAQSYGSDGSIGLPSAIPAPGARIEGLDTLTWVFSTLWWADAVTPLDSAKTLYLMEGETGYPLKGKVCGTLNSNDTFEVMTYFFDLSLISNFEQLKGAMEPVLEYFSGPVSSLSHTKPFNHELLVYPSPASSGQQVNLKFGNATEDGNHVLRLLDGNGRVILQKPVNFSGQNSEFDLPAGLPSGTYFLQVDGVRTISKIVITK